MPGPVDGGKIPNVRRPVQTRPIPPNKKIRKSAFGKYLAAGITNSRKHPTVRKGIPITELSNGMPRKAAKAEPTFVKPPNPPNAAVNTKNVFPIKAAPLLNNVVDTIT